MIDEETDIAVIGAGPSGLIAAREAARKGANVSILEEHEEVGIPCHCAGLLSLKGLREIKVPLNKGFVQNQVRGAHFFSPSKLSFTVERDEPVACVVDRAQFDKFLAGQAMEAGASLRLGFKVQSVRRVERKIILTGNSGTTKASIVLDAEGVASRLIIEMGLQPLPFEGLLPALQYDLEGVDIGPEYVEIHVGRNLAPSFFGWVIPLSRNSARVGLACKGGNPRERLEGFIRDRFGEESKLTRVYTRSGSIVTSGPIPKTFCGNFLVVGDVAGQVKPTTGGGVIWGGICAMIAGRVAVEAVEAENPNAEFLKKYEFLWRRKLGREVRLTALARKTVNKLSDETIDKIFKSITESDVEKELSLEGDMDFQAGAILRVARKKDVLRALLSSARDLAGYPR